MPSIDQLKIQLSIVGVQQALANINRINSGLKGMSQQQKQLNQQANLLRQQVKLQNNLNKLQLSSPQFGGGGSLVGKSLGLFAKGFSGGSEGKGNFVQSFITGFAGGLLLSVAAIKASTDAFKAMTDATVSATEGLRNIAYSTGSQGAALGALRGTGLSNVGELSTQLQERITGGGYSQAAANAAGIFNTPRPLGGVDEGQNLLKALDKLANITNFEARLRQARLLGLEGAASYFNQSAEQRQKSRGRGELRERLFGDETTQRNVADFTQSLKDLGDAFTNVLGALGKRVLPTLTKFIDFLTDRLNAFAEWIDTHPQIVDFFAKLLSHFGPAFAGGQLFNGDVNTHADALNANTRSHIENTAEIERLSKIMQQGIYGTGERTNRALPGPLAPGSQNRFLNSNDRTAFRLSPI